MDRRAEKKFRKRLKRLARRRHLYTLKRVGKGGESWGGHTTRPR